LTTTRRVEWPNRISRSRNQRLSPAKTYCHEAVACQSVERKSAMKMWCETWNSSHQRRRTLQCAKIPIVMKVPHTVAT
jgi:hypothetical protein